MWLSCGQVCSIDVGKDDVPYSRAQQCIWLGRHLANKVHGSDRCKCQGHCKAAIRNTSTHLVGSILPLSAEHPPCWQ
jgi:hypothetical protein